jgi:hypothetical protein
MKECFKYQTLILVILLIISVRIYPQNSAANGFTTYLQFFDEFNNIGRTTCSVADIDSLLITRDVANIRFGKGKIYLFPAIGKRPMAAMFVGKGRFIFSAPTKIEHEQLLRYYEKGVDLEFSQAFLLFNDTTLNQLTKNFKYKSENCSFETRDNTKYFLGYVGDKSKNHIERNIFQSLIDTAKNGFFYAQMFKNKFQPFFFEINPFEQEEVRFSNRWANSQGIDLPEVICQFPLKRKGNLIINPPSKDQLKNDFYKIDVKISGGLNFQAKANVKATILKRNLQWIYFNIFSEMEIDSIISSNNKKIEFYKPDKNNNIWVHLDKSYDKFDQLNLIFYYHSSKLLESDDNSWVYFRAPSLWYPSYGEEESALFDLTYQYSDLYRLVSVGDSVSSVKNSGDIISNWKTKQPVQQASFNIGYYKQDNYKKDDSTVVSVLNAKSGHFSGNMSKEIAFDVINSIGFYSKIFGPCPVKHLFISETPYLHGLAFPGLIHLSWATYEQQNSKGFDELFRAHEVAHQWWGIDVGFKTYHDQWLSEAMAEYAGMMYMQLVFENNQRFVEAMKKSKENILQNRKYLFSDGQQAGPIYLGYRTSSANTQGDYDLIVYEKGAWVLHMLRMMMVDLNTMKEDKFIALLNDFYKSYSGKLATTDNFRAIIEKHMNLKMDWFFNEWIYNTAIPKYKVAYTTKDSPDGKYILQCKIKQENVPDDFVMPMIIKITLSNKQYSLVTKWIDKGIKEFQFSVPSKPDDVTFNYMDSVLGEIEKVDYKEM